MLHPNPVVVVVRAGQVELSASLERHVPWSTRGTVNACEVVNSSPQCT